MSPESRLTKRIPMILAIVASVALGVVLAQFLPSELFRGHGHQAPGHGGDSHASHDLPRDSARASASEPDEQLWTCGMHPHVLEHGPGPCPICGMSMTPVEATGGTTTGAAAQQEPGEPLFYRNPMDPTITSPVPAKDSMGMDYVPVYPDSSADSTATGSGSSGTVQIDPLVVQNMNVQTETVGRRDLAQPIRTVGYLEYDQQRMVTVTTKYPGWIERVYVNYVGERVRRGQPLFEIYSPELVQTEQELLSAIDFAESMSDAPSDARERALSMVDSARQRLGYWDVSPEQVARLEETGEVLRTLKVIAPADGLVMKRMAGLEGMAVQPGMELFHISDLSSLWLSVELFEDQLAWVREGMSADISLSYFPGESFRGKVRFLEPELSEKTRTIRAKIEVSNPDNRLRTGMYATVEFEPVVAPDVVAVPTQAVLRTGQRTLVIVALDRGRFEPREIQVGHEAAGYAEVRHGIEAGEEVVTSAQFLIDSESRLQESIQKLIARRAADSARREETESAPTDPQDHGGHQHHGDHGNHG